MATTATALTSFCRQEKIAKHAAIHNASKIACSSEKAKRITTPSAFAERTKMIIELEIFALNARLMLLEELATMTDEEKMDCLFKVLDKNRDGSLSVIELADGLRKINGDVSFEDSLELAMERVASFDTDGDAKLQFPEFQAYVTKLAEAFGSTFHDLAEMLVLSVVFSDTGNDEEENRTAEIAEETITQALLEEEALTRVMADERTKVLFHLFDLDSDGSVDFAEVVMGLYKITDDLDCVVASGMAALEVFDEEGNNNFDYKEFTRFLVQLIAKTGQTFDEFVFRMTKVTAEDNEQNNMSKESLMESIREMGDWEQQP